MRKGEPKAKQRKVQPTRWIIEWDARNRWHFREQDRGMCSERRVEEILNHTCHSWRRKRLDSLRHAAEVAEGATAERRTAAAAYAMEESARWLYFGESCDERLLAVVAAEVPRAVPTLRPITCWPLDSRDIQTYIAWRSTRKLR
ncbi:MAG TPA: hypothetical protein VGL81_07290 [Polyangiaceae bacterium]|jgi:hypothetical protein